MPCTAAAPCTTASRSRAKSSRWISVCGATSTPAAWKTSLPSHLSIATAAGPTPPPAYGKPLSSSAPSRLPSSPPVPCTAQITTSAGTWRSRPRREVAGTWKLRPRLPSLSSQGSAPDGSSEPNALMSRSASPVHQRPSRAMYTGTTSWRASRTLMSWAALMIETSCSTEGPPKHTATRIPGSGIGGKIVGSGGAQSAAALTPEIEIREVVLEQDDVAGAGGAGEQRLGLARVAHHVDPLGREGGVLEPVEDRPRLLPADQHHEVAHLGRLRPEAAVLGGLALAQLDHAGRDQQPALGLVVGEHLERRGGADGIRVIGVVDHHDARGLVDDGRQPVRGRLDLAEPARDHRDGEVELDPHGRGCQQVGHVVPPEELA